jgi:hypothetical protein
MSCEKTRAKKYTQYTEGWKVGKEAVGQGRALHDEEAKLQQQIPHKGERRHDLVV